MARIVRSEHHTAVGCFGEEKGQTTDAGTRVPLIAYQPNQVGPAVCEDLVDFSDFLPTLLQACRQTIPT